MVEKDKDLFLDMLENPNLTLEDMVSVGHSAESTRFLDKSAYENSQRVRNKFMDADGNFKQNEFDQWYATAAKAYQDITNKDSNLSLLNVTAFNESDITVSPEKRTLNTKPIVSFSPNPDRLSTSIFRVGKTSERERTQSELAQAEKVLLNPVEAAQDPSKARWGDSPNDSWWGNFFGTQVLAQWDEDGDHVDPVTKQRTQHKKGDLKLNDNGTYYYEALDGRDIYGRQVLNKFNTITTDGSFWNQYDFFDSDDIKEKSFVGSVAKNLALVGSMFIPYVGWGVAGASVATQMVGLTGTLGKMLTGSDSPTFSAMEGWAKSLNRQGSKSEYAQQNMLCWENFIDLIGDTTAQLREQRAIFKFAPAILGKGKYGIQSEHLGMNTAALKDAEMAALRKSQNLDASKLFSAAARKGGGDIKAVADRALAANENVISSIADKAVKDYLKDYNQLGESIARAYMVGLTVGDTYGEAKQAGATDAEATLLTIGYAAAENALLKSELGRWIFPELKGEKATMTQIAKKALEKPATLTAEGMENTLRSAGVKGTKAELLGKRIAEMPQDIRDASKVLGKLDDNSRLAWMKKWFNAGKEIFDTQKTILGNTAGSVISNALAEGAEEVSEELLKDFSTSCFNIVKAAQGDKDTRMQGFLGTWDWNEALKRYGMSFFGGVVGGGINSAAADYKQFKDIANMTSDQAMQQLVWMDRNNEMDTFWDTVSKVPLGDKYHSTRQNEDGTYQLGDENDNQDLEVKRALRNQINTIHNILASNGANVDDDGLIGQIMNSLPNVDRNQILGDFRTNALATSVTAGRYLKEYNNLCKAIVLESLNLKNLQNQAGDNESKIPQDLQTAIAESQESLKVLQDAKDKLLNGERSAEFYRDALFETTYGVSESFIAPTEIQFMEERTGKPYALISKEEREELSKKYANWSKTERAEQVHRLSNIFWETAKRTSAALQDSAETYQKIKEGQLENFQKVTQVSANKLQNIMGIFNLATDEQLEKIQELISNLYMNTPGNLAEPVNLNLSPSGPEIHDSTISDLQYLLGNNSQEFITRFQEITGNPNIDEEAKVPLLISSFVDNVYQGLNKTAQEIIDVGYIHPEVKRNLIPVLQQTMDHCDELAGKLDSLVDDVNDDVADQYMGTYDRLNEISESLQQQIDQIQTLNYTPITENLRNFAVGIGSDENVLSLIEGAINKEENYQEALDNIILNEDTVKHFDEAEKILNLYRASIVAARNDNADIDHIYGYNKVLNELCKNEDGWVPLAEIDADTAQLALEDVNMAINRLNVIKGISDLNQGNKLNTQNYAAANKNYILYNKTQKLLTSLLNEDDDDAKEIRAKWNQNGALDELKLALENMSHHRELSGETLAERTLSLNSQQKEAIEREQHAMDDAIYNFFQKNKDKLADNDQARADLAQFIKAAKFDLYDKNDGILNQTSEDIDDGSYLWWLASKAALKSSDFHKVYRNVISEDVAPIPTQELGIFAAIAAIYNGDVFSAFGKAMKQHIYDDWSSKSDVQYKADGTYDTSKPSEKLDIILNKKLRGYLPETNTDIKDVLSSDLVPSFTNILFIEGIPGSGKSTGVFKTIIKMLNELNPSIDDSTKLLDKPIFVAHSTQENAEHLSSTLGFRDGTQVKAFGKEELLQMMSAEYKNKENPDTGTYDYKLGEDAVYTEDGELVSTWKVRPLPQKDLPSVMFIDEWSRYTQLEADLINRFASEYGVQVIAGGDMDQLSPKAYLFKPGETEVTGDTINLSISRNLTPRVSKLGVSMRTGNGQKSANLATLQSYQRNPSKEPINLLYVETNNDLYGDKVYTTKGSNDPATNNKLTDQQLQELQQDIDKLIANLDTEKNEKIGYIYHDKDSNLYKLLSSEKYKDKIEFKSEAAAQGREARYYIVENNRDTSQNPDDYLKSIYTGISRAEQAALVIAPQNPVGDVKVMNPAKQENKLIPDNFTSDGIARFARQRKNMLNAMYANTEDPDLSRINARNPVSISTVPASGGPGVTLSGVDNASEEPVQAPASAAPASSPINQPSPTTSSAGTITGAFSKGQTITNGTQTGKIIDVTQGGFPTGQPENYYKVDFGDQVKYISESELGNQGFEEAPAPPTPPTPPAPSTPPVPPAAAPQASTTWEVTPERTNKVLSTILTGGVKDVSNPGTIRFSQKVLEQLLYAQPGDLDEVIADLTDKGIITPIAGGLYATDQTDIQAVLNPEEGADPQEVPQPSEPQYKVGDIFKVGRLQYTVDSVEFDDQNNEFKYTLKRGNLTSQKLESFLSTLEEQGKFIQKDSQVTPDGAQIQPSLPSAAFGTAHLQRTIEEDLAKSEDPVVELGEVGEDIDLRILGHTWNTNYLGVNFDDDGKPIIPQEGEPGAKRIDQANGLVKLNPDVFTDAQSLRTAIGTIRKSMMFDDNEKIARVIKSVVPALADQELQLKWAFISKAEEHNTGDGGRFYYDPQYKLENMDEGIYDKVPTKMLSLLVGDQNGNCVLEMPIATLGSPFTALYHLGERTNKTNPIYQAYAAVKDNTSLSLQDILNTVITAIDESPETKNSKGRLKPGYKRLRDLSKLWQFTSDGVRIIPGINKNPFNLHAHSQNLGAHYVKNRITEEGLRGNANPFDYSMIWHDMTSEGMRTDVNYSDILLATDDYDMQGYRIVAAGHPFVLRSDSDAYKTTKDMMDRYLLQQRDPSKEKIVKLEVLTPPEASIQKYLVERAKGKDCHYGNEFTAYRILSAIKSQAAQGNADAKQLWADLDTFRQELSTVIDNLDTLQDQLDQAPDENHQEFMSKVYREQKGILSSNDYINKFSKALFHITHDFTKTGNASDTKEAIVENVEKIAQICAQINPKTGKSYLTGVLYRPVCRKNEEPISGFALRVQTGANRFTAPDGKSFRIYSRYDTPIFDLTDKLSGIISSWANQAVQGADPRYPNIWSFMDYKDPAHPEKGVKRDYARDFYTAEGKTKASPVKSPNQKLREKHEKLLGKLGLKDYNKLDNIDDEEKFLEAVRDKYIETPGNVAVVVNGNQLVYTNLRNEGILSNEGFPENWSNAEQQKFESNNVGDNSYTLTLKTADGIEEVNVQLIAKDGEIIFDVMPEVKPQIAQPSVEVFDFTPSIQAIDNTISKYDPKKQKKLIDVWSKIKDIITEGQAQGKLRTQVAQEVLDSIPAPIRRTLEGQLKAALGKEFFEQDENVVTQEEESQDNDNLACTIPVRKKFL